LKKIYQAIKLIKYFKNLKLENSKLFQNSKFKIQNCFKACPQLDWGLFQNSKFKIVSKFKIQNFKLIYMKLAIGHAYNGEHKAYNKYAKELGINSHLFVIDSANWLDNLIEADAYIWHADAKEQDYRKIHDRIYFLEHILKKKMFPDMNMYFAYADKIKENDIFKLHKVPTPKTFLTYSKESVLKFVEKIKYPFVLKDAHGYGGHHVHKVETKKKACEMIQQIFSQKGMYHHLATMKGYFLAQEYIKIDKDLRIIVIGNKIACAYWRAS